MSYYRPWWQDYVEIIWDRYKKGGIDRLIQQCAMGDTRAMMNLYEHFLSQASSHIRHLETMLISDYSLSSQKAFDIYMHKHLEEGWPLIVAYTWLARAAWYGNQGAMDILSIHPLAIFYGLFSPESFFNASYHTSQRLSLDDIPEKLWHSAGFNQLRGEKDGKLCIYGRDQYGRYYNWTYAGYGEVDEDGFGMEEEYDYHVYDEFFNHIYTFKSYSCREFETLAPADRDYMAALQEARKEREQWWFGKDNRSHRFRAKKESTNQHGLLMRNGVLYRNFRDEDEVCIVPPSVKEIYPSAFFNMKRLKTVIFDPSVVHIGAEAFCKCENLESIELPEMVEMEKDAFAWCPKLRNLEMPDKYRYMHRKELEKYFRNSGILEHPDR